MDAVVYRKVDVDGINIFYREAGAEGRRQTILLLHGPFPPPATCSAISSLNSRTGFSHRRSRSAGGLGSPTCRRAGAFAYHVREYRECHRSLHRGDGSLSFFAMMYVPSTMAHPWASALAVRHPGSRHSKSFPRTANAYEEGLSGRLGIPFAPIGKSRRRPNREVLRSFLAARTRRRWQYTHGRA